MSVSDRQTAEWARELSATEDEIERLQAEQKAAREEGREALKSQRARARHLLALISGREGEQLDLPAPARRVEATEVSGRDEGWFVAKVGAGWHLCHDRSPDTYCNGEPKPAKLPMHDPNAQIALIESGTIDPDAVCLECREAGAPVADMLRKALKAQARARAKAAKAATKANGKERCEAMLQKGGQCKSAINRGVSNHFCAQHATSES